MKLEKFVCLGLSIPAKQQAFQEKHPDCLALLNGRQPYGYGWRYDDHGWNYCEYFAEVHEIFRYADPTFYGNHKER